MHTAHIQCILPHKCICTISMYIYDKYSSFTPHKCVYIYVCGIYSHNIIACLYVWYIYVASIHHSYHINVYTSIYVTNIHHSYHINVYTSIYVTNIHSSLKSDSIVCTTCGWRLELVPFPS